MCAVAVRSTVGSWGVMEAVLRDLDDHEFGVLQSLERDGRLVDNDDTVTRFGLAAVDTYLSGRWHEVQGVSWHEVVGERAAAVEAAGEEAGVGADWQHTRVYVLWQTAGEYDELIRSAPGKRCAA